MGADLARQPTTLEIYDSFGSSSLGQGQVAGQGAALFLWACVWGKQSKAERADLPWVLTDPEQDSEVATHCVT